MDDEVPVLLDNLRSLVAQRDSASGEARRVQLDGEAQALAERLADALAQRDAQLTDPSDPAGPSD